MKYRKLRIAWSVWWGVMAVLMVVLWVRSYSRLTTWQFLTTPQIRYYLHSVDGTLAIQCWYREFISKELVPMFRKSDMSWLTTNAGLSVRGTPGLGIESVSISYWLLTVATGALATMPWLPIWRFSLRTLLIATTLVAVVLGAVVYAIR